VKAGCQGFSLLEVLVAFVILALSLGVLMRIFSNGLHNAGVSERYAYATFLAESKLAQAGVEDNLTEGVSDGETEGGFRWHTVISPFEDPNRSPEDSVKPVELFHVVVSVGWEGDDRRQRNVRLSTLRLASKQ
jgi:general secretion pathway protein I